MNSLPIPNGQLNQHNSTQNHQNLNRDFLKELSLEDMASHLQLFELVR